MTEKSNLSVRLVLHQSNRGWILEKFANRLVQHLGRWGVEATIGETSSPSANLHHYMMYMHGPESRLGPATALITHVDRPHKMHALRGLLDRVDVVVCMSRMSVETLVGFGLPPRRLCFVVPGCDPVTAPRRTVVVIATRLYRDLRKREDFLIRLARSMSLDNFRFDIFGLGWEKIAEELKAAGADVAHHPPSEDYLADHDRILERLRTADFYFYPGLDEGSMGLMDALAAGVATISTPQGFHLDIPGALTHAFWDFPEMLTVFQRLARERQDRIDVAARFSWDEYARRHAVIWRAVLEGRDVDFGTLVDPDAPASATRLPPSRKALARRWGGLFFDEGRRLGNYMWKSLNRQTQPSDSRPRKR